VAGALVKDKELKKELKDDSFLFKKTLSLSIELFVLYASCTGKQATVPKHITDLRLLLNQVLPEDTSYRHYSVDVAWKNYNEASQSV
jgi:hypothetical protein